MNKKTINPAFNKLSPGKLKKVFPESPKNNQMFFHKYTLFIYRENPGIWYPLYSDSMKDEEILKLKKYIDEVYHKFIFKPTKTLDSIVEGVSDTLPDYISKESTEKICTHIKGCSVTI